MPVRLLRRRWLLAMAALVALLLLLEGGLRLYAAVSNRQRGLDFHPVYGWHMLPGLTKTGNGWGRSEPGRTNAQGWRDRERSLARPAGRHRIVALGDSFTFGQGVDQEERFSDRLEAMLADTEVVNLGMCATGTDQQLLVFEYEGNAYRPDVVLLTLFLGNDLDDIRNDRQAGWSKPWFRLLGGELQLVPPEHGLGTWLRTRSYLVEVALQAAERGRSSSRRAPDWVAADTLPLLVAMLQRLQERCGAAGARLLVVVVHPPERNPGPTADPMVTRVLAALAQAGLTVADAEPWFRQAAQPFGAVFQPDLHWTALGHQIAAGGMAREIRRLGWLR